MLIFCWGRGATQLNWEDSNFIKKKTKKDSKREGRCAGKTITVKGDLLKPKKNRINPEDPHAKTEKKEFSIQ